MGILITILLGAVVGWLASKVMNRDAEQNWVGNIVVGVLGAFLGGLISSLFTDEAGTDFLISFTIADVFWAFVGAVVLTAILNLATRRRIR